MNILINKEVSINEKISKIKKDTQKILNILNLQNSELSILFVDDQKIRVLNKMYRKIDAVTDVLSFSQNEGILNGLNVNILGDVVISYPQATRQAPDSENTVYEEIIVLIIHSILHLIGYDHMTEKEDLIMRKKETDIFMELFPNN
jgi:probable rRNA maturation factor